MSSLDNMPTSLGRQLTFDLGLVSLPKDRDSTWRRKYGPSNLRFEPATFKSQVQPSIDVRATEAP